MTFEQILSILVDPIASDASKTPFQRAADLHAKLQMASGDSQKPVQARKGRKPRVANDPALNGSAGLSEHSEIHAAIHGGVDEAA